MTRRADIIDAEIAARARSKRSFDLCEERPDYEPLGPMQYYSLSKTALEMAARHLGASFTFNLYVHPIRLMQARNIVWSIWAHVQKNPFAPHVNIVECPALDEGEWVFEANGNRVGSCL